MRESVDLQQLATETLERLQANESDVDAWRALAQCQEQMGAWPAALNCHWAALQLNPHRTEWLADLRRAADQVGDHELTEALLTKYVNLTPMAEIGVQVLAQFLRDQGRPNDAIHILRQGVCRISTAPNLLNQLSAILGEQGEMDAALEAVERALKIAPGWPGALQNRANIRLALGDCQGALDDGAAAISATRPGREQASIRLARSLALLRAGHLRSGWTDYAVRLEPDYVASIRFDIPLPRWTPDQPLEGARLLIVGEQGLGDEIMFAHILPDLDLIAERLALAVTPRLIAPMQRSFPKAEVTYHYTQTLADGVHRSVPGIDLSHYTAYAPMADLMQVLRPTLADFRPHGGYLRSDPDKTARWRQALAELPPGPKIGLSWKSMANLKVRSRYYAPFDLWRPLFERSDVTVVCLQYGDVSSEIEVAAGWGRHLWQPQGLDVKDDLDGVAAISAALDGVAGPLNATTYLAGAVGARLAAVSVEEAWPGLGTKTLPWFPGSLLATPPRPGAWREAVNEAIAFI